MFRWKVHGREQWPHSMGVKFVSFQVERSKNEYGLVTLPASAKRSEVAAWMNFSMKSKMVSHNAVKVGSVASGVKCY